MAMTAKEEGKDNLKSKKQGKEGSNSGERKTEEKNEEQKNANFRKESVISGGGKGWEVSGENRLVDQKCKLTD